MKNQTGHIFLTLLLLMILFLPTISVGSQSPIPPDQAQTALNLMAIECQNLIDFAGRAAQGDLSGYESAKKQFAVTINNVDYSIGDFSPEMIGAFWEIYNNFNSDAASANETAARCQEIRQAIYQKMTETDGILNPPQNITTFEACAAAGYYVNDGTCFIGGNLVYDADGNIVGLYNADCYDEQNFYQDSCWYCEFGNNADGCNDKP